MTSSKALASLIDQSNGKMLTVSFIKKDGSVRVLNGRLGVTKYIKGGNPKKNSNDYITVYDVQNKGYRSVSRDTIVAVRCNGIEAVSVK
jgi:hypothetical protein